jgi:hypothetical protein
MLDLTNGEIRLPELTVNNALTLQKAMEVFGDKLVPEEFHTIECGEQVLTSTWLHFNEPPQVSDDFLLTTLVFDKNGYLHCCSLLPREPAETEEECNVLLQKISTLAQDAGGWPFIGVVWQFPWGRLDYDGDCPLGTFHRICCVDMYLYHF